MAMAMPIMDADAPTPRRTRCSRSLSRARLTRFCAVFWLTASTTLTSLQLRPRKKRCKIAFWSSLLNASIASSTYGAMDSHAVEDSLSDSAIFIASIS